jgi:hypothetical protein
LKSTSLGSALKLNMAITAPYRVWGAYETFIEAFRTAAEEANRAVTFDSKPLPSCFKLSQNGKAEFERCIYLKGWPSLSLGRDKRLDIIVHALEEFTRPEWLLTKSTVYLNYLVVSNNKARLVQALHFDFDADARPKRPHPLFHVQLHLDLVRVPDNELRGMGFDLELEIPQEHKECEVTTRIPTPEMTLPSVLYCLVADHLGNIIFKKFAADICSMLKNQLPRPDFDMIRRSLQESPMHFKSSHWFPPAVEVAE